MTRATVIAALVLVRRPGTSGAVAALLTALLGPACPVPVVTVDAVPAWVGPLDVVWAHTADATDADLADGMAVSVGRIRKCPVLSNKFVALGHNTVRGAAGAAILNAEIMVAEGMLD